MNFDKTAIIANLKNLETAIKDKIDEVITNGVHVEDDFERLDRVKGDLVFVRALMDDIECDRITEFPLVERTNFMSGKTFLEEPDRPYYCSPASETYWSM